jgi:TonB-linked SusC/RagA family outer membrane protein
MKNYVLSRELYLFFPQSKYLLIMKLIVGFLLCMVFQLQASSLAQTVTIEKKEMAFVDLLREIKRQTGYTVICNSDVVRNTGTSNVQLKNMPLEKALDLLLAPKNLSYYMEGESIVVNRKRQMGNTRPSRTFNSAVNQENLITGLVTDVAKQPLAGVTVAVKGKSTLSTSTDVNGRFVLNVPKGETLQVTLIGYITKEFVVVDQRDITVVMEEDLEGIEEVVVVGFGQQKKESMVSSVATVKGTQLRMPNRNLMNNLAGQLPGVIAVQRSGEPGYDNSEFFIRGVSSFAGNTSPLVLVDGVPRSMNDVEPDEIETFSLLKDAAATAVYGSEGANGVVLITTKRGRIQKAQITYRGEASRLTPTRTPRYASAYDYLSLYNEAYRNEGRVPIYSDEVLDKYASGEDPDLYPNTNWWNLLIRDHTYNTRHTLNFRGGTEKARYFVSGAYFKESGLFKVNPDYNNNPGLDRYNLRSNIDIDISKSTLLRVDLSGQYLSQSLAMSGTDAIFERISRIPPHLFPAIYSDGTIAQHPSLTNNRTSPYVYMVESGYKKTWRTFIQSRVDLEQKLDVLTPGLKMRGAVSYDFNSSFFHSRARTPETKFATGRDEAGNLIFKTITNESPFGEPNESSNANKKIYLESAINYDRTFDRHVVGGMLLYYQKETQNHDEALAYRKQAYVGRATYNFDNRYSLEANFGVTGSEQFSEGYRYGFFPAVGLAWNLANEPYFPESIKPVVSNFKLRGSIGRTGNDATGGDRFLYRPTFSNSTGYSLGIGSTGALNSVSGGGLVEGRFTAPGISWEIELKRNYGIDVSLWNNKIGLQVDYFNNHRTDILLQRRTVSDVVGFRQAPWQNFGEVSNKGVDASLNFNHTIGDVSFSARGNFTFARNKILEYDEIPQIHPWMNITGTRLKAANGYLIAERLFTDDDFNITSDGAGNLVYNRKEGIANQTWVPTLMPGDIKYTDLNEDGIVNDLDRVKDVAEPLIPEIIYGFGLNAEYKGFYLSTFFQGAGNVSVDLNNQANAFMPFHWGIEESNVRQEIVENRWTEGNPSQDAFFPRLRVTNMGNTNTLSTWWLRDGSFLRLKNVEFGYVFDTDRFGKGYMKAARLYVMGNNIALWDHVKMYDPELGSSAGGTRYPLPSTWTVGLEVTF